MSLTAITSLCPQRPENHLAMIVFGPIPSRRLGRSLGVNNIPTKHCSYSCVYCQVGRTPRTELTRAAFYEVDEIVAAVRARVAECRAQGEPIDFISFVPDGEPTLDQNLGAEIRAVRELGIPVAVLTNGSMLWRDDVRHDLLAADLVSIEVDAVEELPWRMLDRPHPRLELPKILDGIRQFAAGYGGTLLTQTMLVADVNDDERHVENVAAFLAELKPRRACLAVPTRPPTDTRITPPAEHTLLRAYALLSTKLPDVELLRGDSTGPLAAAGDRIANLLATLTVHPMRREAVEHYLGGPAPLDALVREGRIRAVEYEGKSFLTGAR
jgi:wyosine [tRNA(Phe)-imidazoG37] synthetase (radical SAM superfamily)